MPLCLMRLSSSTNSCASCSVRPPAISSSSNRRGRVDKARVDNGRAEIGPVKIAMPGGSAQGSLTYVPGERDVQAVFKLDVDKFDYGVLARRIKPESDMGGRFSVHVDVNSRAQRLSEIL
eukprot:gene18489-26085_t